jgi:hypothetical protein
LLLLDHGCSGHAEAFHGGGGGGGSIPHCNAANGSRIPRREHGIILLMRLTAA